MRIQESRLRQLIQRKEEEEEGARQTTRNNPDVMLLTACELSGAPWLEDSERFCADPGNQAVREKATAVRAYVLCPSIARQPLALCVP